MASRSSASGLGGRPPERVPTLSGRQVVRMQGAREEASERTRRYVSEPPQRATPQTGRITATNPKRRLEEVRRRFGGVGPDDGRRESAVGTGLFELSRG